MKNTFEILHNNHFANFRSRLLRSVVVLTGMLIAPLVSADYTGRADVNSFIDELVQQHEFDRKALQNLFANVEYKQKIIDAISRPAERTLTWGEYRNIFLKEQRIQKGAEFWISNKADLERAEKELGVPPEIVTAIIGVETRYGEITGSYRVMDALSTLGFDYAPRATFFRKELMNLLLLAREQKQDPLSLTGSYAGAMGFGQFMPSSYRAYAIDFDGDGFTDIWHNKTDAIGSVANYFSRHQWQAGKPVAAPATVETGFDRNRLTKGLKLQDTVAALRANGYGLPDLLDPEAEAMAMAMDGEEGTEYWVGLKNFEVITRYNRSQLYALAVFQLSEAIKLRYMNIAASQ